MNDSKEHILKTAFSLFIERGYKAVTLSDLELATQLTKGAFYHYFKNKEDLFLEVIDKFFLSSFHSFRFENVQSLQQLISSHVRMLEEKMRNLKDITGTRVPDPYYLTLVLEAKKFFPSLEEKIKETFRGQINFWEETIVKAKMSGEIRKDIESSAMAETFTSVGLGIMKNLLLEEELEYALSKVKLQYDQLYRLIKA